MIGRLILAALVVLPISARAEPKPGSQVWIWEHGNRDHVTPKETADAPEPEVQDHQPVYQEAARPQFEDFNQEDEPPPAVWIMPPDYGYVVGPGVWLNFNFGHHHHRHRRY
jgi:hypothetical protein